MAVQERNNRLEGSELEKHYPGFAAIVRKVGGVTSKRFAEFRPNVEAIIPPIFLCDSRLLYQQIDTVNRGSRYEKNARREYAAFRPLEGVVYGARDDIGQALRSGRAGRERMTMVIAEEFIHALSTVEENGLTRCGFIALPGPMRPHNLQPGQIYEYDLIPHVQTPGRPTRIDAKQLRLTENATLLAVHLLLGELGIDKDGQFPLVFITSRSIRPKFLLCRQPAHMITDKNETLLRDVIAALSTGNRDILKVLLDGNLFPILESAHCEIASLTDVLRGRKPKIYV